jgi:hypothetical protein
MIANQLVNIDYQVFDEDLACTFLKNFSPSFHIVVFSFSICTNQLSMELITIVARRILM